MNSLSLYHYFRTSILEGLVDIPEDDFRRRCRVVQYLRSRLFNR
jgi:hypothetical protein